MKDYEEIIRQKGLPQVGQTVRHKRFGTLWRIIEKREVWQNIDDDPVTGYPRMIPAIYLRFWRFQPGAMPGIGKMMGYTYTLLDDTFELNWEILPEDPYEIEIHPPSSSSAEILNLTSRFSQSRSISRKKPGPTKQPEMSQEGEESQGRVLHFRVTPKSVYRAATREIAKLYQLSHGGETPLVDDFSREAFERGEIDEVRWVDWATYLLGRFDHDSF